MTARERFINTLTYQPTDRVPFMEIAMWGQTQERWEREGMPPGMSMGLMTGCEHFGLEGYDAVDMSLAPMPAFDTVVLHEDEREETFIDGWGAHATGSQGGHRARHPPHDGSVHGLPRARPGELPRDEAPLRE